MSDRIDLWQVNEIVGSKEDEVCLCQEEDGAKIVAEAFREKFPDKVFDIKHVEYVANVDWDLKDY